MPAITGSFTEGGHGQYRVLREGTPWGDHTGGYISGNIYLAQPG